MAANLMQNAGYGMREIRQLEGQRVAEAVLCSSGLKRRRDAFVLSRNDSNAPIAMFNTWPEK